MNDARRYPGTPSSPRVVKTTVRTAVIITDTLVSQLLKVCPANFRAHIVTFPSQPCKVDKLRISVCREEMSVKEKLRQFIHLRSHRQELGGAGLNPQAFCMQNLFCTILHLIKILNWVTDMKILRW